MKIVCSQPLQLTQQQQKSFISSLSMSLESAQPPPNATAAASSQNISALTSAANIGPTSQLMQQLQQPLDIKPPVSSVNNPSSVNKIPNPGPIQSAKTDQPQPSPTGNNNKSNINLNHITPASTMTANNATNQQQPQSLLQTQQTLLNSNHMTAVSMQNTGNGMQSIPSVSTPSIIQQQLTNNIANPNQTKHQTPYAMNTYVDPLELSLASLEQAQMNNNLQKNSSQDMNAVLLMDVMHKKHLLSQMGASQSVGPNGFGSDYNGANGAVNNLMNMLAMPSMDPSTMPFLNPQMMNVPGRFSDTWNNLSGNNAMMQQLTAQQPQSSQQHQAHSHASQQQQQLHQQQQHHHQQQSVKPEKIMLTPKPIEELLINPNEKTKALCGPSGPNFGQAYNKYEQNLKNASSWSQLAAAGSPQNPGSSISSSKSKVPSDTFQEYRTKAKEQQQRQKQEQEKMKKQKEQELKRQQESLQKHKSEDLSNGHR